MHQSATVHPTDRPTAGKACGHIRHVGPCSTCQRVQLERWNLQLAQCLVPRRGTAH